MPERELSWTSPKHTEPSKKEDKIFKHSLIATSMAIGLLLPGCRALTGSKVVAASIDPPLSAHDLPEAAVKTPYPPTDTVQAPMVTPPHCVPDWQLRHLRHTRRGEARETETLAVTSADRTSDGSTKPETQLRTPLSQFTACTSQ
jgi:hypothetical protein